MDELELDDDIPDEYENGMDIFYGNDDEDECLGTVNHGVAYR
jgi:hypothetical protein